MQWEIRVRLRAWEFDSEVLMDQATTFAFAGHTLDLVRGRLLRLARTSIYDRKR